MPGPNEAAINATGFGGGMNGGAGVMPMNLPAALISPNVGNLVVGRGYLSMKLQGEAGYSDMGNCTRFTYQVTPTRLDHYSSRVGVRKKDLTVVTQLDAKLVMTLEEATVRNMALTVLGAPTASAEAVIELFTQPLFYASLQFTATNVVGPQWNAVFPNVLLSPTNAFQLISEGTGAWATMEIEGDVQYDQASGQFGWLWSTSFVGQSGPLIRELPGGARRAAA